ncbi:MAG: DUF420 domain-containing protein [Nitrospirae bacterium]|nr:DUF420 domain-containing protein [Nitrospirota bacterium]
MIWLVSYLAKQILFGRESFGGPEEIYYGLYIPLFLFHMLCAAVTSGLWGYNLQQAMVFFKVPESGRESRTPSRPARKGAVRAQGRVAVGRAKGSGALQEAAVGKHREDGEFHDGDFERF